MRNTVGKVCVIGAICVVTGLTLALPCEAHACSRIAVAAGQQVSVSRQVDIDGRFVTVTLNVKRVIPGAPLDGIAATTTASVDISIQDGALLPAGLKVVGVRLEKLRGPQRIFFTPVSEVDAPDNLGFEVDMQSYQGGVSDPVSLRYRQAVVRLEMGSRVIKVTMGGLRVDQIALP